ncbi:MAG: type II toxin-antitoxin system RelE/ParE family toxin [Planctomycetes bacterium]|nr:type II toxin-antitoxin system RelE/ParE family toxin [Planctomycetota bacterium]
MNVAFRRSFVRDLKKIKDRQILDRVDDVIQQVEAADSRQNITALKKLSGKDNYYRIRIGDYRIGLVWKKGLVEFIRCLSRRDIYREFP